MAITLASDSWSDAEVTDGIGRGDLASAARLWVRYWPTALSTAALYVDRSEVPGLAAEALIGTISIIATGRGPREDVAEFVTAAVQELGEDDEPFVPGTADPLPEVFGSTRMTAAFAELSTDAQESLRFASAAPALTGSVTGALTVLQQSYLAAHLDDAPSRECRPAHITLMTAATRSVREGFRGQDWLHLSDCAWCTEAFHELAFSNVRLGALIAPAVLHPPVVVPVAAPEPVVVPVVAAEPDAEPLAAGGLDELLEPVEDTGPRRRAALAGGRSRLVVAGGLTAAAAVLALLVSQQLPFGNDSTSPSAAVGPASSRSPDPMPSDGSSSVARPTTYPSTVVAGPRLISKPRAAKKSPSPAETAAAQPTPEPTKKPQPTPAAPSPPAPSPTPDPSPTPSCNPVKHLLHLC